MGPALLLRRGDRRQHRGRQHRPRGLPSGASPRTQLELRGRPHKPQQTEGPHRRTQTQGRHRTLGLCHRQERETHQKALHSQRLPQRRRHHPHRKRPDTPEHGQRHLPHRPQREGARRQHHLQRQHAVQGETPAPHIQEDTPEEPQLLPEHQTQRRGLQGGQEPAHRLLQLAGLPQRHNHLGLGLLDQSRTHRHTYRPVGGREVLHPRHQVDRQLDLPHR